MTETMEAVARLKREHHAVIAAHTYQSPEVQACADILGDSFALAQKAAATDADTVFLCGVRFMAEGIKILSPGKRVVLVEPTADCPMARQIEPERVAAFRQEHPDYAVVAYINTTAELKAVSDVCVTSSSALKIVRTLPQQNILFIPDKNLAEDVRRAKAAHPGAKVAMHPECTPDALSLADTIGSTAAIIDYIRATDQPVLVATERGVVDRLSLDYPGRLVQIAEDKLVCPDMKRTTVDTLLAAMEGRGGEVIEMDAALMDAARASLTNMITLGA